MLQKIKYSKISPLVLAIAVLGLAIVALSVWGLNADRGAVRQLAANQAAMEKEVSASGGLSSLKYGSDASPAPSANPPDSSSSSSSSEKSVSKTAPPPASSVISVSDSDKQKAYADILAIHGQLEAYYAPNGYYPSDILPSNFTATCSGDCAAAFTPPAGVHFAYQPAPAGCTTATQNCQSYTLDALDANNQPVAPQQTNSF